MPSYRCFRCGRDLSNEKSIEVGIGPICRTKHSVEEAAEDRQRKKNLTCHKGFVCWAPDHVATVLSRFINRYTGLAANAALPQTLTDEIAGLVGEVRDALGLNLPRVQVPKIDVPMFGEKTIGVLGIPPRKGPLGVSFAMPVDHDEQFRRIGLRFDRICPFGLDCQDPDKAVDAVWRLLSVMRYQVEPLLATEDNCDWAWDLLLYQHLGNVLECLGLNDDAADINQIVRTQKEKPVRLAFNLI